MENIKKNFVVDPLSSITRNSRKMLLLVSAISLTVVTTGFFPTKVTMLGIEFTSTSQMALKLIFISVIVYFLVEFFIYGFSDLIKWHLTFKAELGDSLEALVKNQTENLFNISNNTNIKIAETVLGFFEEHKLIPGKHSQKYARLIYNLRLVFEFGIPIIFSAVAIIIVLSSF